MHKLGPRVVVKVNLGERDTIVPRQVMTLAYMAADRVRDRYTQDETTKDQSEQAYASMKKRRIAAA